MGPGAADAGGDVFVVVREAGERTADAARALAAAEVGADRVASIREAPFAAALRRGLEIGVEAGRRWTLCLDADVLLRPGAIGDLVAAAEAAAERDPMLLGASGQVADVLLGQMRVAGNSMYRTAHLPAALATGEFRASKRRPESYLKQVMRRSGHEWLAADVLMGLHDDEQYYRDVFRTAFTHERKHRRFVPYATRYWTRTERENPDHRIALWGVRVSEMIGEHHHRPGPRENENVAIDVRGFAGNLDAILTPAGMTEKAPLAPDAIPSAEVERRLARFETSPEYEEDRPRIETELRAAKAARRRAAPVQEASADRIVARLGARG